MILDFEFIGFKDSANSVLVDGKVVKLKKVRSKSKQTKYTYSYETENKSCDVTIYKSHSYEGKGWFWWNLLTFFVSIFGIFDEKPNKKFVVLDSSFRVSSDKDTSVCIKRLNFQDQGKLVSVETDATVEEFTNVQFYDKEAKKKHGKMKKAKIGFTFAVIILIAVLISVL